MTARFDAERTEMEGTLQQANADIARAQTEAAGATGCQPLLKTPFNYLYLINSLFP